MITIEQTNDLVSSIVCYILGEKFTSEKSFVEHLKTNINLPEEVIEHARLLVCDMTDDKTGRLIFPIK